MNKNIVMIVDPVSTGALYAPVLKQLGFKCYAVLSTQDLPARFLDSYNGQGIENKKLYSSSEIKKIISKEKVAAVIAGAETSVYCAEELAFFFNVPGNNHRTTDWRRRKSMMQLRLKASGLRYIKSKKITCSDHSINHFASDTGYIVKPDSSCFTDSVMCFDNKADVQKWISNIDWDLINVMGEKNDSYLFQERIIGDEYVVDLVVSDGNIKVCILCKYQKGLHNGSHFVYESLEVLDVSDSNYSTLILYAIDYTRAVGIEYGPVHMELIHTNENTVMIEVGARLHGGIAPLVFERCYSARLLSSTVQLVANRFSAENSRLIKKARIVFLISDE